MKIFYYIILSFIFIYALLLFLWVLYPTKIFGIKYNVISSLKLKDLNKGPYLFVVDHTKPALSDIMIMSEEIHNNDDSKKFNLISNSSDEFYTKFYYYTKYNIIKQKKDTVQKCIDKIKKKENVVIFLMEHFKGKGIYYILKETGVNLILVKKNVIKDSNIKFDGSNISNIRKLRGMEFNITYNVVKNYDVKNKNPKEFMDWIKEELFI